MEKRAEEKLREIIEAQGGNPEITPGDIPVGNYSFTVFSEKKGVINWVNNPGLAGVASVAGCPKDRGAGIILFKKLGDPVKKGDRLLKVVSEKSHKLKEAERTAEESLLVSVRERGEYSMIMNR